MTLIFFILLVFLFLMVWRIERRLNARLENLEKSVTGLEHRFDWLRSKMGAAETAQTEASPSYSRETAAAQAPQQAEPEPAGAEPVDSLPPEPPTVPETLEDLELPDEEIVTVQPEQPLAAPDLQLPPSKPQPSLWTQRWQSFKANVDWELFTGVKLFAWLGGLALFIAAGFFVKFSIDRNLIPPAMRLAIGALTGMALIVVSGRFRPDRYRVMRHTLAAGGIGVLYSVVFAATLYYEYLSKPLGFGLLALVSAAAFVLAVRYRGVAISILGALGAYATPLLVSMGPSSLPLLLAYLVIVNVGLYQVVQRLVSPLLLLIATAGTLAALFLGTLDVYPTTPAIVIAGAWIANLALFSGFLWLFSPDAGQERVFRSSGLLVYPATLAVAVLLMAAKPGWASLLVITAAQCGALCLTWRDRGWFNKVIPFSALSFLATLAWVLLRFSPARFSMGFILLLLYGAAGGLGPLLLIWRYGLNRAVTGWLKIFPVAIVMVGLSVMFQHSQVSFWFWPVLLALELLALGVCLLLRAFIQVGLLVLMILIGGLHWLLHVPADLVGMGFFIFTMAAGVVVCAAVFLILKNMSRWTAALHLSGSPAAPAPARRPALEQWLAAAPAGGVCVLLAASFLMPYPFYPHPGLATLTCFLVLVLFAAHRLRYDIPGAAALLAAAAAQAICVLRPPMGLDVSFAALIWAAALFLAALATPFLFFRSFEQWRRLWYAWALFEALQAIFVLYTSHLLWPGQGAQWAPLLLAVLKLPGVAVLVRRLSGQPQRNAILAFHGGVLLFYLSALPVLVLDHGWIGLTFVFEAGALLWLNRRIAHPGLRWVSLVMAPAGLAILFVNLPLLKPLGSLPVLNAAVLTVAACFPTLAWAATLAGYPRRALRSLDLPTWFQWYTTATGFFLLNLIIADVFALPGRAFQVWPGRNFLQFVCYGLTWTAVGGLTWRLLGLPRAIRRAGLILAGLGSIGLILLPLLLPGAAAGMRPVFNLGLLAYLPLLALLYYLFYKEPWDDRGSLIKNLLLALFMLAGFVAIKLESGTVFQTGYAFALFSSRTLTGAAASAAGWLAYGLALLVWPRRLDRPFRLAGVGLILIGLLKALALPFRFKVAFAALTPLLNPASLVFLFGLAGLAWLTLKPWQGRIWPVPAIRPRVFWGTALALAAFCVLNIEIASVFADKGRPFSMLTHGSLSMQLAYSIGWLVYAIALLAVGIKWETVQVRWAAIAAIVITALKVFIRDLWHLGQLYRVGSLFGLAVVLILVSFLYQRFLSEGKKNES
jgi:hypothetical protein